MEQSLSFDLPDQPEQVDLSLMWCSARQWEELREKCKSRLHWVSNENLFLLYTAFWLLSMVL